MCTRSMGTRSMGTKRMGAKRMGAKHMGDKNWDFCFLQLEFQLLQTKFGHKIM